MSEASAASPVESASSPSGTENPVNQTPTKDVVTYETHRKLLDEKKKIQARLETFEAEQKAKLEDEAKKRGDYEALLKSRDEKLSDLEAKLKARDELDTKRMKLAAVLDSVGGDVEPKWFSLIDTSTVLVNPETGEVDPMSVTKTVEAIRKNWPEMIKNPNAAKLPADAPKGNGMGKITSEEYRKLPLAEMKKWRPDQVI